MSILAGMRRFVFLPKKLCPAQKHRTEFQRIGVENGELIIFVFQFGSAAVFKRIHSVILLKADSKLGLAAEADL